MERIMIGRLEQVAGCKNGSCPKIFRSGDRVAVQGVVDTARTRAVEPRPGCLTVEIPLAVLAELSERPDLTAPAAGSIGPLAVVVEDAVVVRGLAETDLTRRIVPGEGEYVVELPLAVLAALASTLAVV